MKKITLVILLMVGIVATAQTTIKGKVVDDNNQPIPGANIALKGSTVGTVSDFDGLFFANSSRITSFYLSSK